MAQPLAGIKVLEFANFIAGPFCGMLLGDMGADVIKIEPPDTGDMSRASPPFVNGDSASFEALNRNKRSLALDLKRPEAREVIMRMVMESDVLLENFRPGVMDKLGLSAEQVRAVNNRLVYTSVSGFGQTGSHRHRTAVNLIIEAASGSLSVTGEPGQMPMRPGIQTGDVLGALFATYAVLAGLVGAARKGEGRIADVSLVEASISAAMLETAEYFATGKPPRALGRRHRLAAPYELFESRDGLYVAIGCPNNRAFERIMRTLKLEQHLTDPRFASYSNRKINENAISTLIKVAICEWAAADIETQLVDAGVPCSIVKDYEQVFQDTHIVEREVLVTVKGRDGKPVKAVRNPVLFDRDGPSIARLPPSIGEHSEEILVQAGYSAAEIGTLVSMGVTRLGTRDGGKRMEQGERARA
ncbi:MAG: CoA transferase [Betaproteobacteria bacterium]|nr:CoA transferase [Betaproteobacteria bacterium]